MVQCSCKNRGNLFSSLSRAFLLLAVFCASAGAQSSIDYTQFKNKWRQVQVDSNGNLVKELGSFFTSSSIIILNDTLLCFLWDDACGNSSGDEVVYKINSETETVVMRTIKSFNNQLYRDTVLVDQRSEGGLKIAQLNRDELVLLIQQGEITYPMHFRRPDEQ